jgi:hypothetical protein
VGNRKTDVYTNPSSVVTNRTYTYNSAANKLANIKIGTTTERTFVHDVLAEPSFAWTIT